MFEFLNPRRVAARKLARMIAQKQPAKPAPAEAKSSLVEAVSGAEPASDISPLDPLESLLDQELRKYGISLG
jgi:hypothetical protein